MRSVTSRLRAWWTAARRELLRDPDVLLFEQRGDFVVRANENARATR